MEGGKTTRQEPETRGFMERKAFCCESPRGKGLLFVFGLLLLPGRVHAWSVERVLLYVDVTTTLAFSGEDRITMLKEKNDIMGTYNSI